MNGEMAPTCVEAATKVRRAERFQLCLSMKYRAGGERKWREGQVQNISSSGVLFCSGVATVKDARLHLSIDLSRENPATRHGRIIAIGKVVRSYRHSDTGQSMTAVHMTSARIVRSVMN